ncbi:hypothetical protein [Polyangium sp. y55x31]|uniref:hypothetical protein n=1 Tax=Polyangium sp. y55x31 TaxID=3042688 RepID=UPI002482318E|nr:hypothetical protein [Polyangium sp. y55x31]MDI1478671.1 hypothetical protein [Polyangium sp. y55x31]
MAASDPRMSIGKTMTTQQVKLSITVFDIDNQPVDRFTVACNWWSTGAGNNSEAQINNKFDCTLEADVPTGKTSDVKITVSHPEFFKEETSIDTSGSHWTNPTCGVTPTTNPATTPLQVKFVLGRMQKAPTVGFQTKDQLRALMGSPTGVLLNETLRNPGEFDYRALFNQKKNRFLAISHPISKDSNAIHPIVKDPHADNWGRVHHAHFTVDPSTQGRFRWVEYGKGTQRFAVAIWIPEVYFANNTTSKLDFIVFYSPTTNLPQYTLPRGQQYPYGLKGTDPWQPYIAGLGQSYLFNAHFLSYQLLAAQKRAVLVMPINNFGEWGPFSDRAGVHRLLAEAAHFVHKQRPWNIDGTFKGPLQDKHAPIPGIGKVVISGFSSGHVPIDRLISPRKEARAFNPLFYTADAASFPKVWKEIWDLDLALGSATVDWEKKLMNWLGTDPTRRFRMYHSEYTAERWRPSAGKTLSPRQTINKKGTAVGVEAEEVYATDGRWSAVYFSNLFLQGSKDDNNVDGPWLPKFTTDKKGHPENIGKHHFMIDIVLAHAALTSTLDPL